MANSKTAKLMASVASLEARLAAALQAAQASRDEGRRLATIADNRAVAAESNLAKAGETIAELKERLFDAETNVAELRGYIGRVQEEDDNASEMVPAEMPRPPQVELKSRVARASIGNIRAHRHIPEPYDWAKSATLSVGESPAEMRRVEPLGRARHWTSL